PINVSDLLAPDGTPRLRFFRYAHPAPHLAFERCRVLNVAALLGVSPERSFVPGDFICDLFVMQRSTLAGLRDHLAGSAGRRARCGAAGTCRCVPAGCGGVIRWANTADPGRWADRWLSRWTAPRGVSADRQIISAAVRVNETVPATPVLADLPAPAPGGRLVVSLTAHRSTLA